MPYISDELLKPRIAVMLTKVLFISTTVFSTSLGKTCFAWRFILKEDFFVLIDYILSETTIYLFCFCVLFSNSYTKIKLCPAEPGYTLPLQTV